MNPVEFLFIGIFSAAALIVVTYPLLSSRRRYLSLEGIFDASSEKKLSDLQARRALVIDSIDELEFEYRMGKLSPEDFERLQRDYMAEAKKTASAADALKITRELEDLIEREVRSRRKLKSPD